MGRPSSTVSLTCCRAGREMACSIIGCIMLGRRRCSLREAIQYLSERPMLAAIIRLGSLSLDDSKYD
jgi:hypothetical protein